jgi:hypothetical protein
MFSQNMFVFPFCPSAVSGHRDIIIIALPLETMGQASPLVNDTIKEGAFQLLLRRVQKLLKAKPGLS